MPKAAYIHIPFCKSKCHYCSFVSFSCLDKKASYLSALDLQISKEYRQDSLSTLYIGGGTPSLLEIEELKRIVSKFEFDKNAEITIEVNPESVDYDYLKGFVDIGFNRLSVGSQSFDDSILSSIGRLHNSKQVFDVVKNAKKVGFKNISLDFIYGLPSQTLESFINDLKNAVKLRVNHISLYGLKIEEGSFFYNNIPQNTADSDVQAQMYLEAVKVLRNAGFSHYEISNFSKSGFESKHNLAYWGNSNYYGFGCAAAGYIGDMRYLNEENLDNYIKDPLSKAYTQKLSKQEKLEEEIFLGLRKASGICVASINSKFGIDFCNKYTKILSKYHSFFYKTENGYAFTTDGFLVSNEILAEFIEV